MTTLKQATDMCKAHGVPKEALDVIDAALESGTEQRRFLPDVQRQGVAALLTLYDGNREAFAEWVQTEGVADAIESVRGLT